MRELRSSKKVPGETHIYTAGEKEYHKKLERKRDGIPINKSIQADLKIMKEELNLEKYKFI